jgi:hypothetical protein
VTTARECAWTASSENPWLTIKAGGSGQGDGTVQFEAVANPDPVERRGAILANNQRADVMQTAGECTISLAQDAASFDPAGGSGRVDVKPSSALCTWTAVADADWISIRGAANGTGAGAVNFDVAPTTGPPRTGGITISGHRFVVTQSRQAGDCSFALSPTGYQTGPEGGTGNVAVTATGTSCAWSVSSSADWITVTAGSGNNTGSGAVSFTVAPTAGPTRSASLTIAGLPFTVTQAQGCSYTLAPDSASVPASGGSVPVTVTAGPGCGWTAASNDPWITIASTTAASGNGTVQLNVAATTGPNRSGTATIAGRTFTLNQGQGCTFTVNPASTSIDAGGGQGSFDVQADGGCAWSANKDADWITISAGATGSGNGTVRFTAAANSGPARSATITAGGKTFAVNQAAGCSYSLSASSASVPGEGGTGSVGVTAGSACAWTAASNADWVTVTGGSRGTGNGTASFTAAANTGAARSGTLTVAGQAFTINQAESCTYSASPTQQTVASGGGTVNVTVNTSGSCRWTATSNVAWITVSASSGSGDGSVQLTVAANTGGARSGTVTVAGRTVTINQGSGCSYSLAPGSQTVSAGAGTGTVAVTAPAGCSWTAAPANTPWVTVTNGASGNGNGTVQYAFEANTGAPRTGTLTIAGHSFTLTQSSGCSFAINPGQQTVPAAGGPGTVNVTTAAGCAWTVDNTPAWAHVTSGASGNGPGAVQFAVDPNTGSGRSATILIATQPFVLTQDGACTFVVSPDTLARGNVGSSERLDVTAPAGCAWTAASNVPWVTITIGATGSGSGQVEAALAANTGPARTGTLTIATHTVNVSQDSGCTYTLSAPGFNAPATGATGSVNVTAGAGCPWAATSQAPWILVAPGTAGAGDGIVPFAVDINATGAPRVGTITIGGQVFTVSQQ